MKVTIEGTMEQVKEALFGPVVVRRRGQSKIAIKNAEIKRRREIVIKAYHRARKVGDRQRMSLFLRAMDERPPIPDEIVLAAEAYGR